MLIWDLWNAGKISSWKLLLLVLLLSLKWMIYDVIARK